MLMITPENVSAHHFNGLSTNKPQYTWYTCHGHGIPVTKYFLLLMRYVQNQGQSITINRPWFQT